MAASEEKQAKQKTKLELIQDRREARRKALVSAKTVQLESDLEVLDKLEEEYGFERVLRIDLPAWDPKIGGPTMVVVRVPPASSGLLKKFETTIHKSKEGSSERQAAQVSLARACMVYPDPVEDPETFSKVNETAASVLSMAALLVVQKAQGIAAEEGKG